LAACTASHATTGKHMANSLRILLKALNRLEEGVLTFGLLGLALMCFVEVVSRYLFNHSFTWYEELARYFMVFLTFLGASLGVKYGLHFCMDFVVTRVSCRLGNLMRVTSNLIAAFLFAVVAILAWKHSMKIMGFGTTSAAMGLPMYIAYLPVSIFSGTMCLRFLYQSHRHLMAMLRDEPLGGASAEPTDEPEEQES
jgi:C4-dicarboxylate transporter DctQ subunit